MINMVRSGRAGAFAVLILSLISFLGAASQDAQDVLAKVREKYAAITDAELKFSENVRFPMTKVEQQMAGTLFIKKQNKYRVEMDDQIIVTDGTTVWSYSSSNNQVVIDKFKQDEHSLSPEKILVGAPGDFTSTVVGEEKVGRSETVQLKLTPKDDQSFIKSLRLWVDRKDWMIRQVEIIDVNDKQTTYMVQQVRVNTGLQDSRFVYQIPRGADVVDLR